MDFLHDPAVGARNHEEVGVTSFSNTHSIRIYVTVNETVELLFIDCCYI